jgi:hypothetical protein
VTDDKRYRECMAEIIGVLKKHDMAGAIAIVDKDRGMFKYHFPTWSAIKLGHDYVRIRAKSEDYPSPEAKKKAIEGTVHIITQLRDMAGYTFVSMDKIFKELDKKLGIEMTGPIDFDPELDN